MSGDQVVTQLRNELARLKLEYDEFKAKSARDFEQLKADLLQKAKKEFESQKERYEQMLDELRRQAAGDKEFIVNELKRRIQELEREIVKIREDSDVAIKKKEEEKESVRRELNLQIEDLKKDYASELKNL